MISEGVVSRSVLKLIKSHPAERWVRARHAKTTEELEGVNRMHAQIRALEQELAALRHHNRGTPPNLAQGDDEVKLMLVPPNSSHVIVQATWNRVFSIVAKTCLGVAREMMVRIALSRTLASDAGVTPGNLIEESFERVNNSTVFSWPH
jgi:hypothetical protein